jgi:hypothetical protein
VASNLSGASKPAIAIQMREKIYNAATKANKKTYTNLLLIHVKQQIIKTIRCKTRHFHSTCPGKQLTKKTAKVFFNKM